jgi:hypothetical protein
VREDRLMRVDVDGGRLTRLTGGFKRDRSPRFLGRDRLVCAWSEGKKHGSTRSTSPRGRGRRSPKAASSIGRSRRHPTAASWP